MQTGRLLNMTVSLKTYGNRNNYTDQTTLGGLVLQQWICNCFDYSRDDIARDVKQNGRSTIMEKTAR